MDSGRSAAIVVAMYIQSPTLGAFSVVLADDLETGRPDPSTVMVRARLREHLALLVSAAPSLADAQVLDSSPGADYPFRLICSKSAFVDAMASIAEAVDYRNVKAAAGAHRKTVGAAYSAALIGVHARLRSLEKGA